MIRRMRVLTGRCRRDAVVRFKVTPMSAIKFMANGVGEYYRDS